MIDMNAFGVGVAARASGAARVSWAGKTCHAAHPAAVAAAGKHRVAAATDASVHRGHT
jgi:hypothetical protein